MVEDEKEIPIDIPEEDLKKTESGALAYEVNVFSHFYYIRPRFCAYCLFAGLLITATKSVSCDANVSQITSIN